MMLHVLPMAAEYRLGVTWCVLNDRALGSIRDIQEFGMGNRIIDTDFRRAAGFRQDRRSMRTAMASRSLIRQTLTARSRARSLANEKGMPAVLDFIVARARMQQTYEHYAFYGRG